MRTLRTLYLSSLLALTLALSVAPSAARADFADHYARRDDVGPHKAPVKGTNRMLVIPVQVAGHPDFDMNSVRTFLSSDHELAMRSYYSVTSGGNFALDVTVLDPVKYDHCPLDEKQFPKCAVARGDATALKPGIAMLRDILTKVDATVDFKQFDQNGPDGKPDGVVDMLGIMTNTSFGGIALPIYALNDGDNMAGGTGGPLIVDGVQIPYVAVGGEPVVMLHEFGHVLGLTDLYSETGDYEGLHFTAMGDWLYDQRPPLFDAETRYRLGWTKVKVVSGKVTVNIAPASEGGEVYKLGGALEYFLVENRTPGHLFDRGVLSKGLAVYHVDKRVGPKGDDGEFAARALSCVNCDRFHPYIMNVASNGKMDWQLGKTVSDADLLFADGESLLPDPSGKPVSESYQVPSTNFYDGSQSGIRIEDIHANGDGSYQVTLTAPRTTKCAEGCDSGVCPRSECIEQPADPAPPAPAPEDKGCGCSEAASAPSLFIAALAVLARRRRG